MLIDLHNHTNISSPCSSLYPQELIEGAEIAGLDGICITEHGVIEGAQKTQQIGHQMNFPVFRGIEVTTRMGDMLVFGYYKDVTIDISLKELCLLVHTAGGVVFAAHPFHTGGGWNLNAACRQRGIDLFNEWRQLPELELLDGIETINGNCRRFENESAQELAKRMNKPGIGGSDAHRVDMIGKAATRFPGTIRSDDELVAALSAGGYEAVMLR